MEYLPCVEPADESNYITDYFGPNRIHIDSDNMTYVVPPGSVLRGSINSCEDSCTFLHCLTITKKPGSLWNVAVFPGWKCHSNHCHTVNFVTIYTEIIF